MLVDQGTWDLIVQPGTLWGYSQPLWATLSMPYDYCTITVSLSVPNPNWHKAGWLEQFWAKDGDKIRVLRRTVYLNGQLLPLIPLSSSLIIFTPVDWLNRWTLKVEAHRY